MDIIIHSPGQNHPAKCPLPIINMSNSGILLHFKPNTEVLVYMDQNLAILRVFHNKMLYVLVMKDSPEMITKILYLQMVSIINTEI